MSQASVFYDKEIKQVLKTLEFHNAAAVTAHFYCSGWDSQQRIILQLHINEIYFAGCFFQTFTSAHWILRCDPEIGQRLEVINYASHNMN